MELHQGATRNVILIRNWAIKFPRFHSWKSFLWGILSNDQERLFWTTRHHKFAPVLFRLPLSLLLVMRRVRPLTQDEWDAMDQDEWYEANENGENTEHNAMFIPVEPKMSSFGWLNGKIVACDYGGPYFYHEEKHAITLFFDGEEWTFKKGGKGTCTTTDG